MGHRLCAVLLLFTINSHASDSEYQKFSAEAEQALTEVRLEAGMQLPYSRRTRKESAAILYIDHNNQFRHSEAILGNSYTVDFEIHLADDGKYYTVPGLYGVDSAYEVVEVIHTHPYKSSTSSFSGGRGEGDVWWAEHHDLYISVLWDREIRLYRPQGLDTDKNFRQVRGEQICRRCF